MGITITALEGGHRLLTIEGAMTIYEAREAKAGLLQALAEGDGLEIDLSCVDEIDTAGLQLLVLTRREGLGAGKPVRLVARSPELVEVMDCYGLRPYFDGGAAAAPDATPALASADHQDGEPR